MRDQIELLRPAAVFAAVVQHGSFRAAAQSLQMSAPLVSQMVSELEARLDVQLLNRTTHRLSLTDAGQRFFETSSAMLDGFREGVGSVATDKGVGSDLLRVSLPSIFNTPSFSAFLARFFDAHPHLHVQLDLCDDLTRSHDKHHDLTLRFAALDEPIKMARLVSKVGMILVGSKHVFSSPSRLEDLRSSSWITSPQSGPLVMRSVKTGESVQIQPMRRTIVNDAVMARNLVEAGIGFSTCPDIAINVFLHRGVLIDLMPGWLAGQFGLFAITPSSGSAQAPASLFLAALVEHLDHFRAKN